MKKHLYILLFLSLAIFSVERVSAQVTIGSEKAPEKFSALQMDVSENKGGLRLPRLTTAQRDALKMNTYAAEIGRGVVIYNIDAAKEIVEFWDGAKWTQVSDATLATNGLKIENGFVKLGGDLVKNTTIGIPAAKSLDFTTGTTGTHAINNTIFTIKDRAVTIKPSALKINTDALVVQGKAITSNTNGTAGTFTLQTNTDKVTVSGNKTTIEGRLIYKANSPVVPDPFNPPVMISASDGRAFWGKLRPSGNTVKAGKLKGAGTTIGSAWSEVTTNDGRIKLTKGKWLVFAKFVSTATSHGPYMWVGLNSVVGGTTSTVSVIGKAIDQNTSYGKKYSFSELVYMLDLDKDAEIYVIAKCSASGPVLNEDYGQPTFFAMLIDEKEFD